MRHVIVTGAAGRLGRHVLAACREAGLQAIGLDLIGDDGADIRACDLADPGQTRAAFAGADAVLHTAAIPRPLGYPAETVFRTNTATTFNVLDALESLGIERLVHASSFSVLGLPFAPACVRLDALPVDERHPARPQDVYALSKWLSEEMIEAWVRRTGGQATSLRMPWIQSAATFFDEVGPRRDTPAAARDLWAYLDARDAAAAFVAALFTDHAAHERLFLSAGDTYSTRPTRELAREGWPDVPLDPSLDAHTRADRRHPCPRADRFPGRAFVA